jgi:Phage integrase family
MRGRLEVVEAVSAVNAHPVYGSAKSHAHRTVPFPRFLRHELGAAIAGKSPDDLVFSSPHRDALRLPNFPRRTFDPAVAVTDLDGLAPHEPRHTAVALAIASGASLKAVQRILGHKSAAMTLDVYGHLLEGGLDAVTERLDAARRAPAVPPMCPDATVTVLHSRAASRLTCCFTRAPGRIRTCDTRFRKPLLYPLSYGGGTCGLACGNPSEHPPVFSEGCEVPAALTKGCADLRGGGRGGAWRSPFHHVRHMDRR